jgi:hypothetical protein
VQYIQASADNIAEVLQTLARPSRLLACSPQLNIPLNVLKTHFINGIEDGHRVAPRENTLWKAVGASPSPRSRSQLTWAQGADCATPVSRAATRLEQSPSTASITKPTPTWTRAALLDLIELYVCPLRFVAALIGHAQVPRGAARPAYEG